MGKKWDDLTKCESIKKKDGEPYLNKYGNEVEKFSKLAWYIMLAVGIVLIFAISTCMRDRPAKLPNDIIDVDFATARVVCTHRAKEQAAHDFKDSKQSDKSTFILESGDIQVSFRDAGYQNEFGVWMYFEGHCLISGTGERWKVENLSPLLLTGFEIYE